MTPQENIAAFTRQLQRLWSIESQLVESLPRMVKKGISFGLHPVICIALGTITACFGGVIRDILLNNIPLIFQKEIYATACMFGGLVYFILLKAGMSLIPMEIICIAATVMKIADIALNCILPVAAGSVLYLPIGIGEAANAVFRNHLPDGLWAYSLISCLLIVWDRKIKAAWIIIAYLMFLGFELLQHIGVLSGTADLLDLLMYFFFSFFALYLNNYFSRTFKVKP